MRITLIAPSLQCGGAERILTVMANYWTERGKNITILTFDSKDQIPFYHLADKVTHLSLGILNNSISLSTGLRNNIQRLFVLRKTIKSTHPDVVISFLIRTNVRVLLSTLGLKIPVIVSERSDPFSAQPGNIWRWLAKAAYLFATRITVFTRQAVTYFSPLLRKKVRVIANAVVDPNTKATFQNDMPRLVAVGRLEYVKGFDLLIKAFAIVRQQYPQATLTIWGEGSKRQELKCLCDELSLSNNIFLPGITKEITQALSEADLFIQTSRWEGFGNALCEAMSVGLPVISTSCSGPREIIRDGIDGLLIPIENTVALATAILDLLDNPSKRLMLATNALEIPKRFKLEDMMQRWDEVVAEVVK
jgi:GalNAc-alpha-(1->4)-GalNAc-alpha-(1->3)-diNAcBac-PP-undecaprenol alpha-1,4-N-acetyl-D-galactosaminyltransferase